jgi:phage FluMu protein gp41
MSQRGGKRPGAGRPKGAKDRATAAAGATLAELARAETRTALATLISVAKKSESDAARVSAANAILDRGYGRPPQAVQHSGPGGGPIDVRALNSLTEEELDQLEHLASKLAIAGGDQS